MEEKKCSISSCGLPAYKDFDKCVLHCDKESDRYNYDEFNSDFEHECRTINDNNKISISNVIFPSEFSMDEFNFPKNFQFYFKECTFYRGSLGYEEIQANFYLCKFKEGLSSLNLKTVEDKDFIFENCTFFEYIDILNRNNNLAEIEYNLFNRITIKSDFYFEFIYFKGAIFSRLEFTLNMSDVNGMSFKLIQCILDSKLEFIFNKNINFIKFDRTTFNNKVDLSWNEINDYFEIDRSIFKESIDLFSCSSNRIEIKEANFEKLVKFSNMKIRLEVTISNSIFHEKLDFRNCRIKNLTIEDSHFKKPVDFFGSHFDNFHIKNSSFDDFVSFEECTFRSEKDTSKPTKFENVTFLNFVSFRDTKFIHGLDLKSVNLKEMANFLDSNLVNAKRNEAAYKNTERETFRIIKHSFDRIGNLIEGNKVFALEMCKYEEELKKNKRSWQEILVFFINKLVSNFGQSWVRPFIILVVTIILYRSLDAGYQKTWLCGEWESFDNFICSIVNFYNDSFAPYLNGFAKGVVPLKKYMIQGYEFISLAYYLAIAVLIYHIIIALKRYTKR